jgi:hypothetical protein
MRDLQADGTSTKLTRAGLSPMAYRAWERGVSCERPSKRTCCNGDMNTFDDWMRLGDVWCIDTGSVCTSAEVNICKADTAGEET